MAWTASKIFTNTLLDILQNTTEIDYNSNTFNASLYTDAITPLQDAASANTAYGAGAWASGEVTDGTEWAAKGSAIASATTSVVSTYNIKFDGTDITSGTSFSGTAVGTLVFSDTITSPVADQGVCYNWFGGTASVIDGQLSIVWHTNGIWLLTL